MNPTLPFKELQERISSLVIKLDKQQKALEKLEHRLDRATQRLGETEPQECLAKAS